MSIIADHLTYEYGAKTKLKTIAVNDISVKIDDGQFIALIGHTGSGKTTFLQLLAGLIKPKSGTVYIDGEDIFAKGFNHVFKSVPLYIITILHIHSPITYTVSCFNQKR